MEAKEFEAKLLGNKFIAPCGCILERICSIKNYEWVRTGQYFQFCNEHDGLLGGKLVRKYPEMLADPLVPCPFLCGSDPNLSGGWVTSSGEQLTNEEVDAYLAQLSRPVFRTSRALGYKHAVLSDDGVWQVSPRVEKVYSTWQYYGEDPPPRGMGRQSAKAINFGALYGNSYNTMEIAGTRTGRLSTSKPNRSNSPKRERFGPASLEAYIRRVNGEYVPTYKATKPAFAGAIHEYSFGDAMRTFEILQAMGFHDPLKITSTSPWAYVSKRESEGGTYRTQPIEMTPKWWRTLVEVPWKFEEDSWVRAWMEKRSERAKEPEKYLGRHGRGEQEPWRFDWRAVRPNVRGA